MRNSTLVVQFTEARRPTGWAIRLYALGYEHSLRRSSMTYAILATGVAVQLSVSCAVVAGATLSAVALAGAGVTRPGAMVAESGTVLAAPSQGRGDHAFYFTRAIYTSWGRRATWATDYPKADQQFLTVLRRLTNLDAYNSEHAVALDDPELRRHPFLYMLEVGYMQLRQGEVDGLRDYLLSGGFLFVDDFWGSREWLNFEEQMRRVLPEYTIEELPLEHPVFRTFYEIREILQVPSINNIRRGRTWEQDGYEPAVRGIFDEAGRLMVMVNWNTDLGDAWEWAEQPDYPLKYSTFAYQMGVNAIVYAMSH
jgi:hypothetical protein